MPGKYYIEFFYGMLKTVAETTTICVRWRSLALDTLHEQVLATKAT
jgi:hypothetical protein